MAGPPKTRLTARMLDGYLQQAFGPGAKLVGTSRLGRPEEQGMKEFGYGKPVKVEFTVDGSPRSGVLSTMRGDPYGHQYYWDRAAILMFQYETSARLPRHVKPLSMGCIQKSGDMSPLDPEEFFIVYEMVDGWDYFQDLDRIRNGDFRDQDEEFAASLGAWLADIHQEGKDDPSLYNRRVRDLIGSSECVMGLVDEAYPHPYPGFSRQSFQALEKRLIDWRWRLKEYAHRLSATHGDFHPWNVMVRRDGDFSVLDRSRGEWGEPADDLATMALNYLLFGILESGDCRQFGGAFGKLYDAYFDAYLLASADQEILEVMAPYFVFRCLVVASPQWYPSHPEPVRQGLFRFMENVLQDRVFDWRRPLRYME